MNTNIYLIKFRTLKNYNNHFMSLDEYKTCVYYTDNSLLTRLVYKDIVAETTTTIEQSRALKSPANTEGRVTGISSGRVSKLFEQTLT